MMTPVERMLALKSSDLLADVDDDVLAGILDQVVDREVAEGEVLLTEGGAPEQLILVLSGSLELRPAGGEARSVGPGELAGELAVIDSAPYTATATVQVPGTVFELPALGRRAPPRHPAQLQPRAPPPRGPAGPAGRDGPRRHRRRHGVDPRPAARQRGHMSSSGLRLDRLIRRRPVADLLDVLDPGSATTILGPDGQALRGETPAAGSGGRSDRAAHDLVVDGTVVGSVAGPGASALVAVLERLATVELERREMADEVLALYREVNLLYALVERFAGVDERRALAHRALTRGHPTRAGGSRRRGRGRRGRPAGGGGRRSGARTSCPISSSGPGPNRAGDEGRGALLVAPMAVGELNRGAVVLTRDSDPFTAAELKLACAVASQAAAFLERVLDAERRRAEAEAREARLRRQIDELRIELDDRRQAENVKRITDTEYFADLRQQADRLRDLVDGRTDEA